MSAIWATIWSGIQTAFGWVWGVFSGSTIWEKLVLIVLGYLLGKVL